MTMPREFAEAIPNILEGIFGPNVRVLKIGGDIGRQTKGDFLDEFLKSMKLQAIRVRIEDKTGCTDPDCPFHLRQKEWFDMEALLPEKERGRMRAIYEEMILAEIELGELRGNEENYQVLAAAQEARDGVFRFGTDAGAVKVVMECLPGGSGCTAIAYNATGDIVARTMDPSLTYDEAWLRCIIGLARVERDRQSAE